MCQCQKQVIENAFNEDLHNEIQRYRRRRDRQVQDWGWKTKRREEEEYNPDD